MLRLADPLLTIKVPQRLSRLFANIFDVLHLTPYSVGHHELLEFDNIPKVNGLPRLLGRRPTPIGRHSVGERNVVAKGLAPPAKT
ncbi:MAG: hypothetical protein AB8B97_27210 [Granulosicoccus sp.]